MLDEITYINSGRQNELLVNDQQILGGENVI
jgi:hypothetical protein